MGVFDAVGDWFSKAAKPGKPGFKIPKWQKKGAETIGGMVPDIAQTPFTPYEGEWTAPLSEQQKWSMDYLQNAIPGMSNPDDLIDRYENYFNPFIEARFSAIDDATGRAQQQVDAQRHMAGAFGDTGSGVARGEIESGRQSAYDQAMMDAFDRALGYAGTDIGNEMQGAGQAMQGAGALFSEGQVAQQTEQHDLDALFAEFLREDTNAEQRALIASQILKNLPTGLPKKGKPSTLAQIASTVGDLVGGSMAPTPTG